MSRTSDEDFEAGLGLHYRDAVNRLRREEHFFLARLALIFAGNWLAGRMAVSGFFYLRGRSDWGESGFFLVMIAFHLGNLGGLAFVRSRFSQFIGAREVAALAGANAASIASLVIYLLVLAGTLRPSTAKYLNAPLVAAGFAAAARGAYSPYPISAAVILAQLVDSAQRLFWLCFSEEQALADLGNRDFIGTASDFFFAASAVTICAVNVAGMARRLREDRPFSPYERLRSLVIFGAMPTVAVETAFSARVFDFTRAVVFRRFYGAVQAPDPGELCRQFGVFFLVFYSLALGIYATAYRWVLRPLIEQCSVDRVSDFSISRVAEGTAFGFVQISETVFRPKKLETSFSSPSQEQVPRLCSICSERKANVLTMPCLHGGFCSGCISRWAAVRRACPLCKRRLASIDVIDYHPVSRELFVQAHLFFKDS